MEQEIKQILKNIFQIEGADKSSELPGKTFFMKNDDILSIARDNGDNRYPYGSDGFNFWAYASGYMHGNEGLFSCFLRAQEGEEPKIAFFVGFPDNNAKYEVIPVLPVPIIRNSYENITRRYTVFTKDCAYYITLVQDLCIAIKVLISNDKSINFTIHIKNSSQEGKQFFLSTYLNPFLRHGINESCEDRWFRRARYYQPDNEIELGSFIIEVNEDLNRTTSITNYGVIKREINPDSFMKIVRHEETVSRYNYVGGSRSSLHSPEALYAGSFKNKIHTCAFVENCIAADILHINMDKSETFDYKINLCCLAKNIEDIPANVLLHSNTHKNIGLSDNSNKSKELLMKLKVKNSIIPGLDDEQFNGFFTHLKKQVEFCSFIKGFVQLSPNSLIGIRDIFQALEAVLYWRPIEARNKIIEAMGFISPQGQCPRQYSLPISDGVPPAMDLRPFIDQGSWVISTIISYVKHTKDFSILNECCGYYDFIDTKKNIAKKNDILKDNILSHLFRIMNYLIKNLDYSHTGCLRALYGDWNDALDGLGVSNTPEIEYGTGVSVMASLQLYQNLEEMIGLLNKLNKEGYKKEILYYIQEKKQLAKNLLRFALIENDSGEKRIIHGWGDDYSYTVGGFSDPDGKSRCSLTANAFWVLSGMLSTNPDIKPTILDSFHKLDSKYGYKTFAPHFKKNVTGVGRIKKLPKGTAENGASYIHATLFAIMALFKMGEPKLAWEQIFKVLPFTHSNVSCSPYVMPNSYGYNPELGIDGQSMQDWQTGSSNVLLKTLIRFVVGIDVDYDGVWIKPAYYIPFTELSCEVQIRNCHIAIEYKNAQKSLREFYVNKQKRNSSYDNRMNTYMLWLSEEDLSKDKLEILIFD